MRIFSTLKNLVYKADFFYTPQLLRIKQQPEYLTLFGGIVSLAIIITLLLTFYQKVLQTLSMVIINSTTANLNADDPSQLILSTVQNGFFMFGIQIWFHDLNSGKRYFDVKLKNKEYETGIENNQTVEYAMQPCTIQHWIDYPNMSKNFDRLKANQWKCIPKNMEIKINGKYSSPKSRTLEVSISDCTNTSISDSRPCATSAQIDQFFEKNGNFYFTIYFLNPLINPESEQFLTHYIQDSNYIIFDKNSGEQGQLMIEDFTVITDESILPFSNFKQTKGGIVSKNAIKNRYNTIEQNYASFQFYKSTNSKIIQRNFQKIDEILSYVGGLFGTIVICLFLVSIYNGYCYEISMAGYLYKREQTQINIFKKYNFLYFLGHLLYAFLHNLNIRPNWPRLKRYHECRQQMLKQFDVLFLFKRVNFLQKTIQMLFQDYQFKGLHLGKQISLDDAKSLRKSYKLKMKLIEEIMKYQKIKSSETPEKSVEEFVNFNRKSLRLFESNNHTEKYLKKSGTKQVNQSSKSNDISKIFPFEFGGKVTPLQNSMQHQQNFENKIQNNMQMIQQDFYSSQSECESDEQEKNQLIESIRRLKSDQVRNRFSRKIWENVEPKIKEYIEPFLFNVVEENQMAKVGDQQQQDNRDTKLKKSKNYFYNITDQYKIKKKRQNSSSSDQLNQQKNIQFNQYQQEMKKIQIRRFGQYNQEKIVQQNQIQQNKIDI